MSAVLGSQMHKASGFLKTQEGIKTVKRGGWAEPLDKVKEVTVSGAVCSFCPHQLCVVSHPTSSSLPLPHQKQNNNKNYPEIV